MINQSSVCVVYYDENYAPPRRKNSRANLTDCQPKSSTRITLDYAIKNKGTFLPYQQTNKQIEIRNVGGCNIDL